VGLAAIGGTILLVAVCGAAAFAIGLFQHYRLVNLVSVAAGVLLFTAILAWTDPNPDLHAYKILLAGIGAGMWVSAVRDERREARVSRHDDARNPRT
jgi:peptidoglycan/LPS O-acetylase OafA/YrhL